MADEIEKLRERVNKEPGSKLFLSLAEQYRNSGKLDEAVEVLKSGIAKQPAYMSARVALGKIYLEKNMQDEAVEEFEAVIKTIPDNLFAQKKLSVIYLAKNEMEKAKKALEAVVALNPMDEEAISSLKELQGTSGGTDNMASLLEPTAFDAEISGEAAGEAIWAEPAPEAETPAIGEAAAAEAEPQPELAGAAPEADAQPASPLEDFGESAIAAPAAGDEFDQNGAIEIEDPDAAEAAIQTPDYSFDAVPEAPDFSLSGIPEAAHPVEEAIELPDAAQTEEAIELPETVVQAEVFEFSEAEPVEELAEIAEAVESPVDMTARQAAAYAHPEIKTGNTSLEDADVLIAAGKFVPAVMIFKRRLEADPSDRLTKQKFEELKMLLKIMKKRAGVKAGLLEGFLAAVEKRKGEFLGRA